MRKKIIVLIVTLLIYLTTIIIVPNDLVIKANPGDGGGFGINYQFIYNVTQNLSNVIYDAYDGSELHKGRAFGSKGEHFAADCIIELFIDIFSMSDFKN
jgi:hypothetical protein